MHTPSNEILPPEAILLIGGELGLTHPTVGGIIIPGTTDRRVRERITQLLREKYPNNTNQYIAHRITEAIAGKILLSILGSNWDGQLSSLEQDLYEKTDYIISNKGSKRDWTIDFTQGYDGFRKKIKSMPKRENHLVIELNRSLLYMILDRISRAFTGNIQQRDTDMLTKIITAIYHENQTDIKQNFINNIYQNTEQESGLVE